MHVLTLSQGVSDVAMRPFRESARKYGVSYTILSPDLPLADDVVRCEPLPTGDQFYKARWLRYHEWIKTFQGYDLMVCDGHDVIFNDSLDVIPVLYLSDAPPMQLNASRESRPIGSCFINASWVYAACGDSDVTDSLKPLPILCAGVMWGTRMGFISWCCSLELETRATVDQGFLNLRKLCDIGEWENGKWVLTCCDVPKEWISVVDDHVRVFGVCRPKIVHQWNRSPMLKQFVQSR